MKRNIFAIGLFGLLSLFAAGWFLGFLAVPKQAVQAQSPNEQAAVAQPTLYAPTPPSIKGIDISLLKARWGHEFTPAAPNVQPRITKEQALSTAYKIHSGLRKATSVVFQLGYLRNSDMLKAAQQGDTVLAKIADSGLVWILVFEGYPSVSAGPPGAPLNHSNEINVVISAITGEDIGTFTYR